MDPMLMIMGMTCLIPLSMFGTMKLVDIWQQIFMVKQGYLKADLMRPNGNQIVKFVKPQDMMNIVEGQAFPFNDDPNYLVREAGIIGTIPKIVLDSKSAQQVRLRNITTGKEVNPQIIHGAGKMSYIRGQNDATTDLKGLKNLVLVGVVCSLIAALSAFAPMLLKPAGG